MSKFVCINGYYINKDHIVTFYIADNTAQDIYRDKDYSDIVLRMDCNDGANGGTAFNGNNVIREKPYILSPRIETSEKEKYIQLLTS